MVSCFTDACGLEGDFITFDMEGGLIIIHVERKIFPSCMKELLVI